MCYFIEKCITSIDVLDFVTHKDYTICSEVIIIINKKPTNIIMKDEKSGVYYIELYNTNDITKRKMLESFQDYFFNLDEVVSKCESLLKDTEGITSRAYCEYYKKIGTVER